MAGRATGAEQLVATGALAGRSCPYCRFPLKEGGQIAVCSRCHAAHHLDCWGDNDGCAVMGCVGAFPAPTVADENQPLPIAPPLAASNGNGNGNGNGKNPTQVWPTPHTPQPPPPPQVPPHRGHKSPVSSLTIAVVVLALAIGGAAGAFAIVSTTKSGGTTTIIQQRDTTGAQATREPAGNPQPSPPQPSLTTFTGSGFTISYPSGWHNVANQTAYPTYVDTRWTMPGRPSVKFIVDYTPNCNCTPEQGGAQERASFRRNNPTYSELAWRPHQFPGGATQLWQFTTDQEEAIDVFFSACGTGYAVAGEAPRDAFSQFDSLFLQAIGTFRPAPC